MGYVKKYFAETDKENNITDAVSAEAVVWPTTSEPIYSRSYLLRLCRQNDRQVQAGPARHRYDSERKVVNQLLLTFGCNPVLIEKLNTLPAAIKGSEKHCLKN